MKTANMTVMARRTEDNMDIVVFRKLGQLVINSLVALVVAVAVVVVAVLALVVLAV